MKMKLLAGLIFLVPVLIYVVQNGSLVPIHFLKWEYAVSQALLVLSTLFIGVILGLLLSHARRNKEKNIQKKAEKKAKKLKKQQDKQQKSEGQKPSEPLPEDGEEHSD